MANLRGAVRAVLGILLVLASVPVVLMASLMPFKIRRARPALWVILYASRLFNLIFNVRIRCPNVDLLRRHQGFIFLNHLSYLEPLALLSLTPVRYLAALELHRRPLVGWMAAQIGTIFVERGDSESRQAARRTIAHLLSRSSYPPLIVFPEGRLGLGDQVYPFRYGIFETACAFRIPYLLCALRFSHPEIAIWKGRIGEGLVPAVWRLATFRGPLLVELTPLHIVCPTPEDDPREMAHAAQLLVAEAVGLPTDLGSDR